MVIDAYEVLDREAALGSGGVAAGPGMTANRSIPKPPMRPPVTRRLVLAVLTGALCWRPCVRCRSGR